MCGTHVSLHAGLHGVPQQQMDPKESKVEVVSNATGRIITINDARLCTLIFFFQQQSNSERGVHSSASGPTVLRHGKVTRTQAMAASHIAHGLLEQKGTLH